MIDAHHHFWKYDPGEYSWIDETIKAIRGALCVTMARGLTRKRRILAAEIAAFFE